MDTPMAIAGIARASGQDGRRGAARATRRVPLRGEMGTAWDTAMPRCSSPRDEARFITGVLLPVDGGMSSRIG